MSQLTIQQAFELALRHHQAGQLQQAEQIYRQILAQQPGNADALHFLGLLAHQVGQNDMALDLIRQAIALKPNNPGAYSNLGIVLRNKGQLDAAIAAYRQAIALYPRNIEAYSNLGIALKDHGQLDEALAAYRHALTLNPHNPEVLSNLGNALKDKGKLDEAIAAYRQALALKQNFPEAHYNLANALKDQGQLAEAIAAFQQALALKPDYPDVYYHLGMAQKDHGQYAAAAAALRQAITLNPHFSDAHNALGAVLRILGQLDAAIVAFRQAITVNPRHVEAHNNLGIALKDKGQLDEAIASFQQAIALNPGHPDIHSNLGVARKDMGQLAEAVAAFRQALALAPHDASIHSDLVYALQYHPAYDAPALAEELRLWNRQHAAPLKTHIPPHPNDPTPGRRLKIGYVSPDFYLHAESFFTVPLLANHDHAAHEIYCYSSVLNPDRLTQQLTTYADVWRDVRCETDEALASIIRQDRIDILVDTSMHSGCNRALLFARKPAPVQVCWLAYPGTTGLETMDYRITDSFLDPPDADLSCYTEQSIRLPHCWLVYDPLIAVYDTQSDIPPRPAEQTGPLTFGSLNNPGKLNDQVVALWGRVLQAVPASHLLLQVLSQEHKQRIRHLMESLGITPDRLQFVGKMSRAQYLRCYDRIDIALDTLPYNGITTTCDALYMGVPVLTLAGPTAAGRNSQSMLGTVGLSEWVAHTPDEFVYKAAQLATDLPRLIELRCGLRARITRSPLMDGPAFARDLEAACRHMWRQWCAQAPILR